MSKAPYWSQQLHVLMNSSFNNSFCCRFKNYKKTRHMSFAPAGSVLFNHPIRLYHLWRWLNLHPLVRLLGSQSPPWTKASCLAWLDRPTETVLIAPDAFCCISIETTVNLGTVTSLEMFLMPYTTKCQCEHSEYRVLRRHVLVFVLTCSVNYGAFLYMHRSNLCPVTLIFYR